jgi:hypothetical protein
MSTSSYVLAKDIGCSHTYNPYAYLQQGIDTMFTNPQSIATSGKTGTVAPGATTEVMMGFFADQVRIGGWKTFHTEFYRSLYSQTYGNDFLPCHYSSACYMTESRRLENHNLGQIYLNNSMAWTFMEFPKDSMAYELINPNDPKGVSAPVFVDKSVAATGIINADAFIHPKGSKYYPMIQLALQQAYAATDFKGPCGSVLTFVCNILGRSHPGWEINNNSITANWYKIYKNRRK